MISGETSYSLLVAVNSCIWHMIRSACSPDSISVDLAQAFKIMLYVSFVGFKSKPWQSWSSDILRIRLLDLLGHFRSNEVAKLCEKAGGQASRHHSKHDSYAYLSISPWPFKVYLLQSKHWWEQDMWFDSVTHSHPAEADKQLSRYLFFYHGSLMT
jgi:hypothetical protein